MTAILPLRWDIFCRVVDNFGDAGVCWRLARQLVADHGQRVRLICDRIDVLAHLDPTIVPTQPAQSCAGVDIIHWGRCDSADIPDVVIETFACELPSHYVEAMAKRCPKPVWLNLEYLSAESWVEDCHGLPSPHPRLPLVKHFFFPGFSPRTGGLLRESDLMARRAACQADPDAAWASLGLPLTLEEEVRVSLFAYENAALDGLLNAWKDGALPVRCIVRPGRSLDQIAMLTQRSLRAGDHLSLNRLSIDVLPFCPQPEFDTLLWLCDLNFVRGEDSFVRAQWAGRPFVWHIYPQTDEAHLHKLNAFLDLYTAGLPAPAAEACRRFWIGWNGAGVSDWTQFWCHHAVLAEHARRWNESLAQAPDLARNIVDFARSRLK